MQILIIRHGEPDYAVDSLTEKGWREAELLADRLSAMKIDAFYASPLGRAQDTARATLERMHREARTLDWLHEFRGTVLDPKTGKRSYAWDFMPQYWTRCPELADMEAWTQNALIATGNSAAVYGETVRGLVELYRSRPECIAALGSGGKRGNPCLFPARFFPDSRRSRPGLSFSQRRPQRAAPRRGPCRRPAGYRRGARVSAPSCKPCRSGTGARC